MKGRRIFIGSLVLLLVVCVVGLAIAAQAQTSDPVVLLDAEARQFQFQNVKPYSGNNYPNLFQDKELTAIMPGDQVDQEILVKAENLNKDSADIFLSAESMNSDITSKEAADFDLLMEQAQLTVAWSDSDGNMYNRALTAGERVLLGSFHEGDSITLKLHFELPITAGNDLQNLKGEVGWLFQAEIFPPKEPDPPTLDFTEHKAYIIGRPNGNVYPEMNITRAEVATVFFRLLDDRSREAYWAESNMFEDVSPKAWYNIEVSTLANAGILNGRSAEKFEPEANITRAEVTVICDRFLHWEAGSSPFTDIENHWAKASIEAAYANGAVYGYPDKTFCPDKPINRAEFMSVINRIMNRIAHKDHLLDDMNRWPDNMNENAWYYAHVQEATNSHTYTRGENDPYEVWEKILPPPDWNALKEEWSKLYSASRQVADSRNAEYN